jgi:hypothetical protein
MPKIFILDTCYPDFLKTLPPVDMQSVYSLELRKVMDRGFGTSDFYSHALKMLGWQAFDCIGNYYDLQRLWMLANFTYAPFEDERAAVLQQIAKFNPDVVFIQDLSFFDAKTLATLRARYLLAGQCSCPMPTADRVSQFHVLFTSFPHYVDRFKALGVQAEYLPLAFDPRMKPAEAERDLDISFVGGVGRQSHWEAGTDALEAVAAYFGDRFHWYGYGLDNLPADSALRKCYRGTAWGREMYAIYGRSKVVINRHGEVAEGYANNLRMFEATGCGAMLMTEEARNLEDLFPRACVSTYRNSHELLVLAEAALNHWETWAPAAKWAQRHTEDFHGYSDRMATVDAVLSERLARREVHA